VVSFDVSEVAALATLARAQATVNTNLAMPSKKHSFATQRTFELLLKNQKNEES